MRAASLLAVVVALGLALCLILTSELAIGGGQLWIGVIIAACLCVGWLAARLNRHRLRSPAMGLRSS